jgi:hypothetical protein
MQNITDIQTTMNSAAAPRVLTMFNQSGSLASLGVVCLWIAESRRCVIICGSRPCGESTLTS